MAEARFKERSLALRKALSPSEACGTPAELGRLTDGSLPQSTVQRLCEHVSRCPRCQTELTLLNEFENAAPRPDEKAAVKSISARLDRRFSEVRTAPSPRGRSGAALQRRSVFTRLNVAGFAAAAATLALSMIIRVREDRAPQLGQPSPAASLVLRSAGITTLSPAGDLDVAPKELRWEPQAEAASYSVQVMEVDHAELWSAETRDPRVTLPPALRTKIVPGKPLLWEVSAKDAAGRAVAWSGKQRFMVRR